MTRSTFLWNVFDLDDEVNATGKMVAKAVVTKSKPLTVDLENTSFLEAFGEFDHRQRVLMVWMVMTELYEGPWTPALTNRLEILQDWMINEYDGPVIGNQDMAFFYAPEIAEHADTDGEYSWATRTYNNLCGTKITGVKSLPVKTSYPEKIRLVNAETGKAMRDPWGGKREIG
jgi:hypothetical protein